VLTALASPLLCGLRRQTSASAVDWRSRAADQCGPRPRLVCSRGRLRLAGSLAAPASAPRCRRLASFALRDHPPQHARASWLPGARSPRSEPRGPRCRWRGGGGVPGARM